MIAKLFKRIRLRLLELRRKRRSVHYLNAYETLPSPLSKAEEEEYIRRLDSGDDFDARQVLIERNLRLVVYIARKFDTNPFVLEDLISIGTIGLIKGVNTYRSDKNIKLATYASKCIENEILMHLRKAGRQKIEISLDEPLNMDWDGNELLLGDVIATEENPVMSGIEKESELSILKDAIKKLKVQEQNIINLRFGVNGETRKTQKEVADIMSISQSYISRLEKRIVKLLKKEILKMS
ncbi:MAG: sigma-70 family RNA polymerase sigma factor [Eubacteriaceae bacterium]|jgi:RNA polymerase sporulation-specific sigma factor|nr:sigma-70 family RNA polymerase sigma factor [Eubacteriaceae bacterium]